MTIRRLRNAPRTLKQKRFGMRKVRGDLNADILEGGQGLACRPDVIVSLEHKYPGLELDLETGKTVVCDPLSLA